LITLTAPSAASAGGSAFTLTVGGLNFVPGSQVLWNNSPRTTTYVNSEVLTASITASDLSASGTRQLSVSNPVPGGGVSTVNYTIYAPGSGSVPVLTSLSTANVTAGAAPFTMTVSGSGFTSASVVQWNGSNRATTFVSATKLTAAILAGDLASAATTLVTVFNTGSTGGVSNALNFAVGLPAPAIPMGGVTPIYSTVNTIQPGEWVTISGTGLCASTLTAGGALPTSLGGTTVTFDGIPGYLYYVSPTQINVQAPDDTKTGPVPVVVTTAAGSFTSSVTLAAFGPAFSLLDNKHVAGLIIRTDGSGTYGGGTYDIVGPTGNSLGYATIAAKAGDILELYGVGLGPTNPGVPAGQSFTGAAPTTNPVQLKINNVTVPTLFAGLSGTGLYQINVTIPAGLGTGDVPLAAIVGGVQTQAGVVITLQ
jgi:uncharacterized protein (TIGR03437 family)